MCDGVVVARPCVFCAIVSGEIPASFVLREPAACAFLDARPVFKGHVLVVPPVHVDDFHTLSSGYWLLESYFRLRCSCGLIRGSSRFGMGFGVGSVTDFGFC